MTHREYRKFKVNEETKRQIRHTVRMVMRVFVIAVPFHATVISFIEWPFVTTVIIVGAAVHIVQWEFKRRRKAKRGHHGPHGKTHRG